MNASWIWEKNWLLDSHGIIQNRSAQMELQRTIICEACYEDAMNDGGYQTVEGWWMFENEYEKARKKDASMNLAPRRRGPEDYGQDMPTGETSAEFAGSSQHHAETSKQAGLTGKLRHIDVRQQWVTQLRNAEVCKLVKVDTKVNLADPFTKMFTSDEHARLREMYMFEQQMPVTAAAA